MPSVSRFLKNYLSLVFIPVAGIIFAELIIAVLNKEPISKYSHDYFLWILLTFIFPSIFFSLAGIILYKLQCQGHKLKTFFLANVTFVGIIVIFVIAHMFFGFMNFRFQDGWWFLYTLFSLGLMYLVFLLYTIFTLLVLPHISIGVTLFLERHKSIIFALYFLLVVIGYVLFDVQCTGMFC